MTKSKLNFILPLTQAHIGWGTSWNWIKPKCLFYKQSDYISVYFKSKMLLNFSQITLCLNSRGTENVAGDQEIRVNWMKEDSEKELERIFERNMVTRVGKQPKTSALCKNKLSNHEERQLAFLSGMLYCTCHLTRPLSPLIYTFPVYIQMQSYIASDNVIPENRLEFFSVFNKDGWFCQYPMAG